MKTLHRLPIMAALGLPLLLAPPLHAQHNTLTPQEKADGWILLFDGESLAGWTPTGNPVAWAVEDGMIACKPGGGGWLRTVDQYRDFELYADFRISPGGNSGLAIRASATGDPAFTGMEIQILDSHGQEPAIFHCGAVYNAIAPRVQAVTPAGEWNTYRVLIEGNTLNVWLNDVHIHIDEKLDDRGIRHRVEDKIPLRSRVKSGYIAFQDHGAGAWFRNVKIRPIDVHPLDRVPGPDEPQWRDIFNGRNLDGWFAKGNANWSAEHGVLVGRDGPGHLYTDEVFRDFELRAKVWINERGNSGLYFRARPPERNPDSWPDGYEAQVDHHDPVNFTGSLYGIVQPEKMITRNEEWFDYNVRCVGNEITIAINGVTLIETTHDRWTDGHVALQGHHRGSEVRWRDIQIRVLDDSRIAPGEDARTEGDVVPLWRQRGDGIVRVFYCTHSAGYRHEVLPESRRIMERLAAEHSWLEVKTSDDIAELTPHLLREIDLVMFYTTGELPMTERQKAAFRAFCESGGGFVGVHSATDTFYEWPWYVRHVGGSFRSHPWNENVGILVVDPSHPSTRIFGADRFEIADEIYTFHNLADDRHVLLKLDPETRGADGGDFPLAWTRLTGQGRVFYTALGHRPEVWRDERFIAHLLGGIRWAGRIED